MASRRSRKSKAREARSRKSRNRGSMKWVYFAGGIFAVLILAGLIVGYNSIRSYLRSDEFRLMLGEEVGYELNGDAELSIFQWDGWSVKTDNFSFKVFRVLDAGISTHINRPMAKGPRQENRQTNVAAFSSGLLNKITRE